MARDRRPTVPTGGIGFARAAGGDVGVTASLWMSALGCVAPFPVRVACAIAAGPA